MKRRVNRSCDGVPCSRQLYVLFACQRDEPGLPGGTRRGDPSQWLPFLSVLSGFSVGLKEPKILPRLSNGSPGIYEACEMFSFCSNSIRLFYKQASDSRFLSLLSPRRGASDSCFSVSSELSPPRSRLSISCPPAHTLIRIRPNPMTSARPKKVNGAALQHSGENAVIG